MEEIFYTKITEYEAGWGQRDDGYYLCLDEEALKKYIRTKGNSGSYKCYWRCGDVQKASCDKKTYNKIKKLIESNENKVVVWEKEIKQFNLFKKL